LSSAAAAHRAPDLVHLQETWWLRRSGWGTIIFPLTPNRHLESMLTHARNLSLFVADKANPPNVHSSAFSDFVPRLAFRKDGAGVTAARRGDAPPSPAPVTGVKLAVSPGPCNVSTY
jgi:hypothetical protein